MMHTDIHLSCSLQSFSWLYLYTSSLMNTGFFGVVLHFEESIKNKDETFVSPLSVKCHISHDNKIHNLLNRAGMKIHSEMLRPC